LRAGALTIVGIALPAALAIRAATLRTSAALVSATALVIVGVMLLGRADVRAFIEYQTDLAANRHLGQATSSGRGYRVLDRRFYEEGPQATFTVTRAEAARFLSRAVIAFVVVPAPWQVASWSEAAVVPQQIAWYVLVALACVGWRHAWTRDPLVTLLFSAYALAGVAVIAPNSGNVGTLVRHRDVIVPAVACLAGVGIVVMLERAAGWRAGGVALRPRRLGIAEGGGVFGVNLVDAASVAILVLGVSLGVATLRVFRPLMPSIDVVGTASATSGERVALVEGRDLTAYLRMFVAPSGEPLMLSDPIHDGREARWQLRTTSRGNLEIPAGTRAGTYDVYVYDEGRQVDFRPAALHVEAP